MWKLALPAVLWALLANAALGVDAHGSVSAAGARHGVGVVYKAPALDPAAVRNQQAEDGALLVDVRTPEAYRQEHIYGACNVPLAALKAGPRGLPRGRTLVLYCTCTGEHASQAAARRLHDRYQYHKLAVLLGGMDAWREAGYKMVLVPEPHARTSVRPRPTARPLPATSPGPRPTPTASADRTATPVATPMPTPLPAPDHRDPMDEQRGTSQSP